MPQLSLDPSMRLLLANQEAKRLRISNIDVWEYEGGTPEPDLSPLAAWNFNEGSGTVANDAVGTRDLTLVPANWATGGHTGGGFVRRNTTDPLVQIPSLGGLQTPQRSLAMWLSPLAGAAGWYVVFHSNAADAGVWGIGNIGGNLYMRVRVGGSNVNLTQTLPPNGTYVHLALTYDGTTLRSYLNGVPGASAPASGVPDTADIGILMEQFNGILDDVRMFDYALTQGQVLEALNTPV